MLKMNNGSSPAQRRPKVVPLNLSFRFSHEKYKISDLFFHAFSRGNEAKTTPFHHAI